MEVSETVMDGGRFFQEEEEEEEDGEEEQFFDAKEDISSVSDSYPSSPVNKESSPNDDLHNCVYGFPWDEFWLGKPDSVQKRRNKFIKWMGLDSVCGAHNNSADLSGEITVDGETAAHIDRLTSGSGAVLRDSESEKGTFMSSSSHGSACSSENEVSEETSGFRIKNLDNGTVFVVDQLGQDGSLSRLREVGSDQRISIDEFQRGLGPSPFVQHFMQRNDNTSTSSGETARRWRRTGWLRRLGLAACIVVPKLEESTVTSSDTDQSIHSGVRRVKVRPYKKSSKEISAVYTGQDIKAHDGAILTMKFSPDGQYLASGGEDGIVRVWSVMRCERTDEGHLVEHDPSCIYVTVNGNGEIASVYTDKEEKNKSKGIRRTSDSACVVIPSEVFRLSEKPLHEFHGHSGDVLDVSWSKNKSLLSSSVDKTVRMWQVGYDHCLKVFLHNNFVTCVQFNPVNENYFISGSIDGKVRIWEISSCHVVNWTDIRDIVTAVCYHPDGKKGVVGSITGRCHFYGASDNQLQLEARIYLQGKKKFPHNRITAFQFSPSDPQKLLVTSADSQVRILDGVDVVCKYKGPRNGGSQVSASFTSDGRHILSASEDSNVFVWSHMNQDGPTPNHAKSIRSCEHFYSSNASVAIPWPVLEPKNPVPITSEFLASQLDFSGDRNGVPESGLHWSSDSMGSNTSYLLSSGSYTLSQRFFSEVLPKGSATWPEEKLPPGSTIILDKSQCKILKGSCQKSLTSHAWGQVILTAGWDGRIKSYHNYGLPIRI